MNIQFNTSVLLTSAFYLVTKIDFSCDITSITWFDLVVSFYCS